MYGTPWTPIWVVVSPEDGVVRSSSMRSGDDAIAGLSADYRHRAVHEGLRPDIEAAIERWIAGDGDAITSVPAAQDGGEFYQEVWQAMRRVVPGQPVSYAELAAMAGRPSAIRAAGQACAKNRLAPFVPCHRIVRSDRTLGNYGYGPDLKAQLLAHEARG